MATAFRREPDDLGDRRSGGRVDHDNGQGVDMRVGMPVAVAILIWSAAMVQGAAAETCGTIATQVRQADASNDLDALKRLFKRAKAIEVTYGDEYEDRRRDLLGAVLPVWDDTLPQPDEGFTTRFVLQGRQDTETSLDSDCAKLLPSDDPTLLAILAANGLAYLEVDDASWDRGRGHHRSRWEAQRDRRHGR